MSRDWWIDFEAECAVSSIRRVVGTTGLFSYERYSFYKSLARELDDPRVLYTCTGDTTKKQYSFRIYKFEVSPVPTKIL